MGYTIQWEEKGVVVSFDEEINSQVNASANHEMYMDPRSDNIKYQIWDLSGVDKCTFNENEVKCSALRDRLVSHRLPKLKMGFVTNDEEIAFLCNDYIFYSVQANSEWEFKISDSLQAIKRWIET